MRLTDTHSLNAILVVTVILLGAYFRLVDLNNPGFWGDEETSSIPARSLALEQGPKFASGMQYQRALPHTYLSAWSARIWGVDRDFSYRVPSAVFGIFSLVLIFFATRHLLGFKVALVATSLLAFSEWHIILSRTARMYGPLLFFSTWFCFAALCWHFRESARFFYSLITIVLFAIAASFNFLVILVLPILFIPVVFLKFEKLKFITSLSLTGLLGVLSIYYFKAFASQPFSEMNLSDSASKELQITKNPSYFELLSNFDFQNLNLLMVLLGLTVGASIFVLLTRQVSFSRNLLPLSCFLFVSFAYGLLAIYGAVYGVLISILLLPVFLSSVTEMPVRTYARLFAFLLVIPVAITSFNFYRFGLVPGLKTSLSTPFPYLLYQFVNFPGVILLFLAGTLASVLRAPDRQSIIIKILVVSVLIPPALFGFYKAWSPPRFFVTLYPLLVIVAAFGMVAISERIKAIRESRWLELAVLVGLPLSGILGGHGLPQAKAVAPSDYGALFYGNHLLGIKYPDHRSHGCFVKRHLQEGDIVVAEDALQMYWYIGRVDYWLRHPSNIGGFLYSDGDEVRDVYVNSKPTSNEAIGQLKNNSEDRIWLITSGETRQFPDHFLKRESPQRKWLVEVTGTQKPVLKGRDGLSETYCLNCNLPAIEANPWDYDC